jgi:3-oxoacyl-[acyl-carrier protein] reductase
MENNKELNSLRNYIKSGYFKDKNIIITGSTGSIGSEVLYKLLKCGSKIVAFYNESIPNTKELSEYINTSKLKFIQLDFEKISTKLNDKFTEAITILGGILDILIFCHGKFLQGDFRNSNTTNFDKNIKINVRSNLHFLSLSIPFLKITKGNVVMISSMETKIVEKGDFLHALSKSMINSLVQNSALELASYGIRINAVAPSFINSKYRKEALKNEMNKKYLNQMKGFNLLGKELINPGEVADTILFLASNEANFMTGEIINIDCGFELNHDTSFLYKDDY